MSIEQHLTRYLDSGEISPTLGDALREPSTRRAIYRSIIDKPVQPFRALLLRLLEEEIAFRNALAEDEVEDEEDYFEGVYHCAFLLSRCQDVADIAALWRVQHLNRDIGEIDVGHFVGAGVSETLSFLDEVDDTTSQAIAHYIRRKLDHPRATERLDRWEKQCCASIRASLPADETDE